MDQLNKSTKSLYHFFKKDFRFFKIVTQCKRTEQLQSKSFSLLIENENK